MNNLSVTSNAEEMKAFYDYLTFESYTKTAQDVKAVLGMENMLWNEKRKNYYTYTHYYEYGEIEIYYNPSRQYGVYCVMRSNGCQTFRICGHGDFAQLFLALSDSDYRVTRIDVTVDDVADCQENGKLNLKQMARDTKRRHFDGRFRKPSIIDIIGKDRIGKQIIFGSDNSDFRVNFYDKAAQENESYHWVRAEIRFRRGLANSFIEKFLDGVPMEHLFSGVLEDKLRFVRTNNKVKNKQKWKTATYWEKFILGVGAIKLAQASGDNVAVEGLIDYVKKYARGSSVLMQLTSEAELIALIKATDITGFKYSVLLKEAKSNE